LNCHPEARAFCGPKDPAAAIMPGALRGSVVESQRSR
jgi:hypothetical protein